ncbi:unnamed protein product [Sphenostylis stenocarpa]|uniref:Uncharacterized protein n=1 Tax=Sphenostylis stenocarpa TaxID=92480 RepID=A0AA86W4E2_9FABA|nr:unnamed protein product [Sphenostylis stenocarpa]
MAEEVPGIEEAAEPPASPKPSTVVAHNMETEQMTPTKYSIISRNGVGTTGKHISLLVNLFKVSVNAPDTVFFQYNVAITLEDKRAVDSKGIGRKVIDRLYQAYASELGGKRFAYDGKKTLYTVDNLPRNEFKVSLEEPFAKRSTECPGADGSLLEETKRSKCYSQSKIFMVEISFAAKIPLQSIAIALKEAESDANSEDALRVLDTVLRQRAANCDVGAGLTAVSGFHSSFRPTQRGLALNMDVSTTMIIKPGPVIDFLLSNQQVRELRHIDWEKVKNDNGNNEGQTVDITVYEYFVEHCHIDLISSAYLPCLDVGKPKRPIYFPLELCSLVSLQRYTKVLSPMERASLAEKSRQKPKDRIEILKNAVGNYCFDDDPVLAACGISVEKQLTLVKGRVLETPKTLLQPSRIEVWAVVNFSARCDTSYISRELIRCGMGKGINIARPYTLMEEEPHMRKSNPVARVERMIGLLAPKLPRTPDLILCVLPERKNWPWKRKCLSEIGVVTQCISPVKITDQYLNNVLLKINSKLGGINSLLAIERSGHFPQIEDIPTMILGMDVSHRTLDRVDIPSIAAVVGSQCWPLISRYRASVRMQTSKVEMIDALFKPVGDEGDAGMIRELLLDFYHTSKGRKPTQFIIFRDGVSESQFKQVLTVELNQIIKAYQRLGEGNVPKFTVIVAQKNHHTRLFQADGLANVPPGTVVDTTITHRSNYDFYMCAHAGMIGTSRPVHYHVLLDEIGFSADDLQNLIHSLSYVYALYLLNQRSTTATSVVAPICYAHHAAFLMGQLWNLDDLSETGLPMPELPKVHKDVERSMFFC